MKARLPLLRVAPAPMGRPFLVLVSPSSKMNTGADAVVPTLFGRPRRFGALVPRLSRGLHLGIRSMWALQIRTMPSLNVGSLTTTNSMALVEPRRGPAGLYDSVHTVVRNGVGLKPAGASRRALINSGNPS